jgi:hypothetical protein
MGVRFHPHTQERIKERGATEDEVKEWYRVNNSRLSLGVLAFDTTSHLTVSGIVGIIELSK